MYMASIYHSNSILEIKPVPDDVAAEFAAFKERASEEEFESVDGKEVLEKCAFDFKELLHVDQGIIL